MQTPPKLGQTQNNFLEFNVYIVDDKNTPDGGIKRLPYLGPNLPDQHNTGAGRKHAELEYRKILAQWMFLDRGDNSHDSAHADYSSFLSID